MMPELTRKGAFRIIEPLSLLRRYLHSLVPEVCES
jgi:hypothetical protein